MRVLFPHGVPYSWNLDGTVDASKREVEVMEIILMSKSGKSAEFFGDLFELDLSKIFFLSALLTRQPGEPPVCLSNSVSKILCLSVAVTTFALSLLNRLSFVVPFRD